jgi:hypothetical protein
MYNMTDENKLLNLILFFFIKILIKDDLSMDDWKLVIKLKAILKIQ